MPLFVLCYSPYCPHCVGLPEGWKRYYENEGNRTDLYLSMLDCFHQDCHYFAIRGTPHIVLVYGTKLRYWKTTPERAGPGWNRWFEEHTGPNLRQVHNITEIESAKNEPKDGGSTFILEVPSESDQYVPYIRNLSRYYRIYNDTFVFIVNSTLQKARFTAYMNPYCGETFKGPLSDIEHFINEHRFGVYHRFDKEEFKEFKNRKGLILMREDKPTELQFEAMKSIAKQKCDKKLLLGWADLKKDMKIMNMIDIKGKDLPVLYMTGKWKGDKKFYKGRMFSFWEEKNKRQNAKNDIRNYIHSHFNTFVVVITLLTIFGYYSFPILKHFLELAMTDSPKNHIISKIA